MKMIEKNMGGRWWVWEGGEGDGEEERDQPEGDSSGSIDRWSREKVFPARLRVLRLRPPHPRRTTCSSDRPCPPPA